MSQKLVYELLKALGGKAKTGEISKLAKKRYPERSLHNYVSDRLHRLMKWGIIGRNNDGEWFIIEEYPS
mgnify:CR=1 FL=1